MNRFFIAACLMAAPFAANAQNPYAIPPVQFHPMVISQTAPVYVPTPMPAYTPQPYQRPWAPETSRAMTNCAFTPRGMTCY